MNVHKCLVQLLRGVLLFVALGFGPASAEQNGVADKPFKILHIMSYHAPWRWTDGQLQGFQDAMRGVPAEYKVFQMDTKRNSGKEDIARKAAEARQLIDTWKPDLVYTTDDDVQEHVVKHYVGHALPFVFSGVNKDPRVYGFEGSPNVTGVLEQEHFVASVKLMQQASPGIKRIAVVLDDAAMWHPVRARMTAQLAQLPDVEFASWDVIRSFDEYKAKLKEYQTTVDAIALIGIFNFKDAQGENVRYQDVLRWTAENSTLPDFGFWIDRVHYGTLAAVTVSEREQGLAAGRMARAILTEHKSPASFQMLPTTKGTPAISLARAQRLGIPVKSGLLLSAEVVRKFEWEK